MDSSTLHRVLQDENSDIMDEVNALISDRMENLDTLFLLFSGALVFLMQAGFAMLCAGSIRAFNVQNILLKNMFDACGGAIGFYTIGYALAYGDDGNNTGTTFFGNKTYFFQDDLESERGAYISWFFQFAFAATAATIVAGTIAERCKMNAYFCYSMFLTAFVYPVIVHSIWDAHGFLSTGNSDPFLNSGMIDFAGSGVVHMTGGCTALIAAIILGPRIGRFYDEHGVLLEEPHSFAPHSVSLQVLGTFLLWFGWYGFNPGSTLSISGEGNDQIVALCAVTTTLAAASGLMSGVMVNYVATTILTGEPVLDLSMAMNGALSGLVGVTAGCSVVQPWAAIVIGLVSGCLYYIASKTLVRLRIDDAVDAIPVHYFNGMWGCLATGLFADPTLVRAAYGMDQGGILYGGGGNLLANAVCGILWINGWVLVTMFPFLYGLKRIGWFRVDAEDELVGLDASKHGGFAYNFEKPSVEDVERYHQKKMSDRNLGAICNETEDEIPLNTTVDELK